MTTADPQLVDPDGPDNIAGTLDDDNHLLPVSSCLNAGDAGGSYAGQLDFDGEARVLYGRVDIGCDEALPVAGDTEPDQDVDLADLSFFASYWLDHPCGAPGWCHGVDWDHSSAVDLGDFSAMAAHWAW